MNISRKMIWGLLLLGACGSPAGQRPTIRSGGTLLPSTMPPSTTTTVWEMTTSPHNNARCTSLENQLLADVTYYGMHSFEAIQDRRVLDTNHC